MQILRAFFRKTEVSRTGTKKTGYYLGKRTKLFERLYEKGLHSKREADVRGGVY